MGMENQSANQPDVHIFHAGTGFNQNKKLVNEGGRVLAVTALGENLEEALEKAKSAACKIEWQGRYFRKDIGLDLLAYPRKGETVL